MGLFPFAEWLHLFLVDVLACNKPYKNHVALTWFCGDNQRMNSADDGEIQIDEETYKLAEKCAKKLGLTVDEFVSTAIDEKFEKLKRTK